MTLSLPMRPCRSMMPAATAVHKSHRPRRASGRRARRRSSAKQPRRSFGSPALTLLTQRQNAVDVWPAMLRRHAMMAQRCDARRCAPPQIGTPCERWAWSQLATPVNALPSAWPPSPSDGSRWAVAVVLVWTPTGSLRRPPLTQPMVKPGPTPRISCEARLNEEEATLDTHLQESALRQLHPLVRHPRRRCSRTVSHVGCASPRAATRRAS